MTDYRALFLEELAERLENTGIPADRWGIVMEGWEPVYDVEQATPHADRRVARPTMCGDCAYRPNSPEKQGSPDHVGDAQHLEDLAHGDRPFHCHDGMRLLTGWHHPGVAGLLPPMHVPWVADNEGGGIPSAWDPPITRASQPTGGVPHKADGSPAFVCAGWDARRAALTGKRWGA